MGKTAYLFPGQGAQAFGMLDGVQHAPTFAARYATVCEKLDTDVLARLAAQDGEFLNRNEVSSLLTVLASVLSHDLRVAAQGADEASYAAGYSVGQWTALYAAGMLSFEQLVELVHVRAMAMNRCVTSDPGGMIGVIGLKEAAIEAAIAPVRETGQRVSISNYNCLGQYSLSAESSAIPPTLEALQPLEPRRLLVLPVAGAWHSELMADSAEPFAAYLETISFAPAQIPVIDNVTGVLLPTDETALKAQLVKHLSHPVRWQAGIKHLITLGCTNFLELGYGRLLTKFGFFIDRSFKHQAFYVK